MDFIDEILIPCHGISGCRIGHALSEEISITIQNHDTLLTFSIALVKLAGAHPRPLYYFLGLKKTKNPRQTAQRGSWITANCCLAQKTTEERGECQSYFLAKPFFLPITSV